MIHVDDAGAAQVCARATLGPVLPPLANIHWNCGLAASLNRAGADDDDAADDDSRPLSCWRPKSCAIISDDGEHGIVIIYCWLDATTFCAIGSDICEPAHTNWQTLD